MVSDGPHLLDHLLEGQESTSNRRGSKHVSFRFPLLRISSADRDEGNEGLDFSPLFAACFTINFLIGTGFLTIPWAFVQGGLLLSTILIVIATVISDISKDFILEAMARAEAVVSNVDGDFEDSFQAAEERLDDNETDSDENLLVIKERKFELVDLCRIFIGERTTILFSSLLSLSTFNTLWVYTVVFITVLQSQFSPPNNHDDNAGLFTFIFACIVVPLSCLDFEEQKYIQVLLAICRVLMLVFMISTSLLFPEEFRENQYSETNPFLSAPLFRFAGLSESFSIILFALGFQVAIPGISQVVTNKRKLGSIFRLTFLLSALLYTLLGVSVPLATGVTVAQSSNVMWSNFRGGTGELNDDGEYVNVALWAKVISYFVVLFPAIDVTSVFPLNAIVLGDNLLDTFYSGESHATTRNRKKVIIFRLLSSIPPIFGALFIRKLGVITDYTGTLFFTFVYCFPAALYVYSKGEKGTSEKTYYQTWGTNDPLAIFTFIFGSFFFIYLILDYI